MQQRTTVLAKFEIYAAGLVAFVLVFGAINFVEAVVGPINFLEAVVLCQDWETGAWNKDPSCDQVLTFKDRGVAGLSECQYRIVSVNPITGDFEQTKGWTSAGTCFGSSWDSDSPVISISIGSASNCKYEGGFQCVVYQRAKDNAGNESTDYNSGGVVGPAYKIDYLPPSGGSIFYTNGFTNSTSVVLTVNDGTDNPGSGIDISTRIVQRKLATLSDSGICGVYGPFFNLPITNYPSFTDSGLVSDKCYKYQYLVEDKAGNQTTYTSLSEVKVDKIAPTVRSFIVSNTQCEGASCLTAEVIIESSPSEIITIEIFAAAEDLFSGIDHYELWKTTVSGDPNSWGSDPLIPDFNFSADDTLEDGTWSYGIHVIDNVGNCITERGTHCGGIGTDSLDTRLIKGPIKVTKITVLNPGPTDPRGGDPLPPPDTSIDSPPTISISISPSSSIDDQDTITFLASASDSSGIAETKIFIDENNDGNFNDNGKTCTISSCVVTTGPYEAGQTISYYATAKDFAGNFASTLPTKSFVVISSTPLSEVTPIPSFINDTTPDFTFNSAEAGIITFGGDCSSSTTVAIAGDNTITLNELSEGVHTNCTITVTDVAGNVSTILNINSFTIDTSIPSILDFDVNPKPPTWVNQAAPNVVVNWHASDTNSGLLEVQVWRSSNGGVSWGQIPGSPFAASSDNWINSINDSSPGSGTYLYGIHVVDMAGNKITQTQAGFNTISVQVDKTQPVSAIQSPGAGSFHGSDFSLSIGDVDIGGSGLDVNECMYSVLFDDGTCGAGPCKPALYDTGRTCNANTPNISISTDCAFEGINSCRVLVKSKDTAGNGNVVSVAQDSIRDFSIDLTWPVVEQVSCSADLGTPCSAIQQGVEATFQAAVSDNIQLSNCQFLWRTLPNGFWQEMESPNFIPTACQGDHIGDCLEASTVHTFDLGGTHDIRAQCWDSAFHTMPGDFVTITVEVLDVTLNADPTAGSINTKFDLSSQVAGTATGNANFKFDCTNDGIWEYEIDSIDLLVSDPGWITRQGEKIKVTAPDTFSVKDLCQYSVSDIYTTSSLVERGISSAQDILLINVGVSDDPEAINLQDNSINADYCFVSFPPTILSWTFSDINPGDIQSAYQVEVATNPEFDSPIIDTGKVQSANSEFSPLSLSFADTYYWRVKVWDSLDNVSPFAEGAAFTTPDYAYPAPDFTWTPTFPLPEEEIQFQDTTVFAPGSFNQSWLWSFGDGTTSTQQNPVHTYNDPSPYIVSLKSSDDIGSCGGLVDLDGDGISNGQDASPNGSGGAGGSGQSGGGSGESIINVTLPFPDYLEISPF